MQGFPLRLRVALAKSRLWPAGHGAPENSPILYIRPEELLHSEASHPVSHEGVHAVLHERKSIVWMGGSEPLAHAGIGHLARLILQSGHFLFLETNAILLRQRIHEFQPKPRFYFAMRLLGGEAEHDRRMERSGAFRAAMEGIRAAQLSGFFVCAKLELDAAHGIESLLLEQLKDLDLDGFMMDSPKTSGWSGFLRSVEQSRAAAAAHPPARHSEMGMAAPGNDCEEAAQTR